MPQVPPCLSRRYEAMDQLVSELTGSTEDTSGEPPEVIQDPAIRLMCDLWLVMKENPDIDVVEALQKCKQEAAKKCPGRQRPVSLYPCAANPACDLQGQRNPAEGVSRGRICSGKLACRRFNQPDKREDLTSDQGDSQDRVAPISKVLNNLNAVTEMNKKFQEQLEDVEQTEKQLEDKMKQLEDKEREGLELLKEADCMWNCMESAYQQKLKESEDKQSQLIDEVHKIEKTISKWRRGYRDLELQMKKVGKVEKEIEEKKLKRENDINCLNLEIENLKKQIKKDDTAIEASKKAFESKKKACDEKVSTFTKKTAALEKELAEEIRNRKQADIEGQKEIKAARDELNNLSKKLLEKKLANQDILAEYGALMKDVELLKENKELCKQRCKSKSEAIDKELQEIEEEMANFTIQCSRCHQTTDTDDVRKFCTDCPRCLKERSCYVEQGVCCPDSGSDCVCMSVKEKFIGNVFENMCSYLEAKSKSASSQNVADTVLDCLKSSLNGKLNNETKALLKDFIMSSLKKNLNSIIIGGAVKTRCEMDLETYNQLMLCLKQINVSPASKDDKGQSKLAPCPRWGGSSECQCKKSGKLSGCPCAKKAPPPTFAPCPPTKGQTCKNTKKIVCDTTCCIDEGEDDEPEPSCDNKKCSTSFKHTMRAAQCSLDIDALPVDPIADSLNQAEKEDQTNYCFSPFEVEHQLQGDTLHLIKDVMKATNTEISTIDKTLPSDAGTKSYATKFALMDSRGTATDFSAESTNLNVSLDKYVNAPSVIGSETLLSVTADLKNYDVVAIAPIAEKRNDTENNISVKGNTEDNDHRMDPKFLPKQFSNNEIVGYGPGKSSLKEIFHITKDPFDSKQISESVKSIDTPIPSKQTASDMSQDVKQNNVLKISVHPTPYNKKKLSTIDNFHLTNHPTVLRTTPSRNYLIILDKEFEKESSQLIADFIGEENKRVVEIVDVKESEICLILKDDDDDVSNVSINDVNKALLVITACGNIKLSVHARRPTYELDEKSSRQKYNMRSPVFKEVLNQYVQDSKSIEEISDIDLQLLNNGVQRLRSERSRSTFVGDDPDLVTIFMKEKNTKRSFSTLISRLSEEVIDMKHSTHLLDSNQSPKDEAVSTMCDKTCNSAKCECRYLELDTSENSPERFSSIISDDDCRSITLRNAIKSQCGCRFNESGNPSFNFNQQCFHVNVDQSCKNFNKKSPSTRVAFKDFCSKLDSGKRFPRILE
ncbi:uncharacterized protein LOC105391316 isoform X1 [Plutella xylostella]|uniref:uncharacterized protein LOC105391316 isoform X1 n=1 Tax=Plutella xylostella TaxID=51655 RepID=UPI0020325DD8|nr:uncharacterized protein LOC105391316 isoform X1 [Plutella xylostella]